MTELQNEIDRKDRLLASAKKTAEEAVDRLSEQRKRFGQFRERKEEEVQRKEKENKRLKTLNSQKAAKIGDLLNSRSEAYNAKRASTKDYVALEGEMEKCKQDNEDAKRATKEEHTNELQSEKKKQEKLKAKHAKQMKATEMKHEKLMEELQAQHRKEIATLKHNEGKKVATVTKLKVKDNRKATLDRHRLEKAKASMVATNAELNAQIDKYRAESYEILNKKDDVAKKAMNAEAQSTTSMKRSSQLEEHLKETTRERDELLLLEENKFIHGTSH